MKYFNKNYNILFIAPYLGMTEKAETVIEDLKLNVPVYTSNLPYCLDVVRTEMAKGIDAVITRGGNALKIRETFNIPVIEIEVSVYDIIKAINKAKVHGRKIGVIGFPNIIYNVSSLSGFMDLEIAEIQINNISECTDAVKKASRLGVDVIVGDRIAVETAAAFGLKGELIKSDSYECITKACYKAIEIAEVRKRELAKSEQIKVITELTNSGIVAVDNNDIITLFNAEAAKILKIPQNEAIGKSADELLPELKLSNSLELEQKRYDEFVYIGDQYIVVHKMPIIIRDEIHGAMATFQRLENIKNIEQKARKKLSAKGHLAKNFFDDILGNSTTIKEVTEKAKNYSRVDSVILITGETGTGKEIFAQSIHNHSLRNKGPFVGVNCAALPLTLLESELFGYVKGAFTGAKDDGKTGLFEQAHGGTIFLDEIGEIPLSVQARLLRVLEEGEVQRIGDNKIISVDVRIISATNKNLRELIKENKFREDLYYRINVLNLRLPSLRERVEDIPVLVRHFVDFYCDKYDKARKEIDEDSMIKLCQYCWPGNIRQLKNVVERLVVESSHDSIIYEDLNMVQEEDMAAYGKVLNLDAISKQTIQKALTIANNNKVKAAQLLGIDRTTLWRKMKEWGIK